MPEIIVKIEKGSKEVSNKTTEVSLPTLPALLIALKSAKGDANSVLTKLVDDSKDLTQTRKQSTAEDDDDEGSSEEDIANKKPKC